MRARAVKCKTAEKAFRSPCFFKVLEKILDVDINFFLLPSVLSLLAGVASVEIFVDELAFPSRLHRANID